MMHNIDKPDNIAERTRHLELKIKELLNPARRYKPNVSKGKNSIINSHNKLSGLADDDHTQYLNETRHDTTDRHTLGTVVPHDDAQYITYTAKVLTDWDSDTDPGDIDTALDQLAERVDDNEIAIGTKADDTAVVHDTGDETIAGTKTFSSFPVTPSSAPTTDYQVANKDYVDDIVAANFVARNTPYTSTSYDEDSFSTTSKTKIDLSATFSSIDYGSVPGGIKAILVTMQARDSASASGNCWFALAPNDTANSWALMVKPYDRVNDTYEIASGIVPCDANGDVYYQCTATGKDTLDVIIEIWGYWL